MAVGTTPDTPVYDPSDGEIYVSNGPDGTESAINASTNTVVATISVGAGPIVAAFDSANDDLYVPNTSPDGTGAYNVSVIGGGPAPHVTSPGTYSVTFTETGLPSGTSWNVTFNGYLGTVDGRVDRVFREPERLVHLRDRPLGGRVRLRPRPAVELGDRRGGRQGGVRQRAVHLPGRHVPGRVPREEPPLPRIARLGGVPPAGRRSRRRSRGGRGWVDPAPPAATTGRAWDTSSGPDVEPRAAAIDAPTARSPAATGLTRPRAA